MDVRLKPEHEAWLRAEVERGAFNSIESALEHSIELARADEAANKGLDLTWTHPLIEQAEKSIAAGKGVRVEDAFKRIDEHLKSLG